MMILLSILHLLGDFYIQTDKIVKQKRKDIKALIFHSALYTLIILSIVLIAEVKNIIAFCAIVFLSHFMLDFIKLKFEETFQNKRSVILVIDQASHIIILFIVEKLFFASFYPNSSLLPLIPTWLMDPKIWKFMVGLLFLTLPTSILIKSLFKDLFKTQSEIVTANAGEVIGYLERYFVLLLGLSGNYAAITIVIAAKSLARFKQFDEKDFAEKYLIGTLTSILLAVMVVEFILIPN